MTGESQRNGSAQIVIGIQQVTMECVMLFYRITTATSTSGQQKLLGPVQYVGVNLKPRKVTERRCSMKLLDKQIVTVQVYPGRKFGAMIGSNDGLIGILLNSGEYIDVPQERVRIVSVEVEKMKREEIKISSVWKSCRYCGKKYPSDSPRKNCACKDHGRLFAVGILYQPKKGGGADGD